MRWLFIACVVLGLAVAAGTASASSSVPDATLAAFGLSGMQQITDVQGTTIRGTGFTMGLGSFVGRLPTHWTGSPSFVVLGAASFGAAFAYVR